MPRPATRGRGQAQPETAGKVERVVQRRGGFTAPGDAPFASGRPGGGSGRADSVRTG
jgi:hypothetical protein